MKANEKNNKDNFEETEILKELIQEDFYSFLIKSFYTINPGIDFISNWHINFICGLLNDIHKGKLKRLIINIPPRSLKSVIVSASFPSWILGKDPSKRIIVASYNQAIGIRQSNDTRKIMQSDWYKEIFPESILIKGDNQKHKFSTKHNGYRFTTSINGTLTGEGGDILILDDPCNPVKINNKKYRDDLIDWYRRVFSSRLNNKKEGVIILVMQRLHEDDLTGFLLKNFKEDWHHLKIETICNKDKIIYNDKIIKFRKKNELLFKNDSEVIIKKLKESLGEYNFNAQYQQEPISKDSNFIKLKWINFYKKEQIKIENLPTYISIDCASSSSSVADYTVIAIFCLNGDKVFLIDIKRVKLEYLQMKKLTLEIINKYNPINTIIEDKGVGISLINELKVEFSNIIAEKPKFSKEIRLMQVLSFFENNLFYIPENEIFNKDLIQELINFPHFNHDDQVDAIVQFMLYLQRLNSINKNKNKPKNIKFL